MKALSFCQISHGLHLDYIIRSIQSVNEPEKEIGLFQLGELFDKNDNSPFKSLNPNKIRQLEQLLEELTKDEDEIKRIAAKVYHKTLIEWTISMDAKIRPGPAGQSNT
jgi:hypothetical protein